MLLGKTYSQPEIHQRWRETYRQHPSQLVFDNQIYDWLFRILKPSGLWVDAGCGSGERTVQLARRCPAVLAVDVSPEIQEVAKARVVSEGLNNKVEFLCSSLEELTGVTADNVHCRGVLMHVPEWQTGLDNLCCMVNPGGYLVLFEGSCHSFEALIARSAHRLTKRKSKLVVTEGGLEFWSDINGFPFLVRVADLDRLMHHVMSQGLEPVLRRTMQFVDPHRFPPSLRRCVIWLNRIWFRFGLPFGSGVILVARKKLPTSHSVPPPRS